MLRLQGTPDDLYTSLAKTEAYPRAESRAQGIKGQLLMWQRALLFNLGRRYDVKGGSILEIGTLFGSSAIILCHATPRCTLTTLNPAIHEAEQATLNLTNYWQITVLPRKSQDHLREYTGPDYDMIFVDGDHNRIGEDLPWFNRLKVGGLMLFHDYSPKHARIPCHPVYDALNDMAAKLGRELDVIAQDTDMVGMAGIIRREGETWPPTPR
jgi:predicted O-methyltransferase YrrM